MAKRKERVEAVVVVGAIANEDALAVHDVFFVSLMHRVGDRNLRFAAREGDRQFAGGIDVAEQNVGNGRPLLLAAVVGIH